MAHHPRLTGGRAGGTPVVFWTWTVRWGKGRYTAGGGGSGTPRLWRAPPTLRGCEGSGTELGA